MHRWLWLTGAAVALFVSGLETSHAQETGVTSELEQLALASPAEKMEYASKAMKEIQETAKTVNHLTEDARRAGSIEELQCLSSRNLDLRALLQVSKEAEASLKDGASQEVNNLEFRKIVVALTKSRQLLSEAERCGDINAVASGDSVTTYNGDATDAIESNLSAFDMTYEPLEASLFQ